MSIGDPIVSKEPLFPYNLIVTQNWICMIKRICDGYHGFSVNVLGFAGYLLATNNSDMDWLLSNGPESLLEGVASYN